MEIARAFLAAEFPEADLVITGTVERPIGWGVIYNHRKFVETDDPDEMLLGPGPLLVRRADGVVVPLCTFQPLEDELGEYAEWHSTGRVSDEHPNRVIWRAFAPLPGWPEVEKRAPRSC